MRRITGLVTGLVTVALLVWATVTLRGQSMPSADSHQHLVSPNLVRDVLPPSSSPIGADALISLLDAVGIRKAAVLSSAYLYGNPATKVDDEYRKVRNENDWTSQQVARFPDRLRGFCSFNPLREYALDELDRCAKDPQLRYGLKLHFRNAAVDYHNAKHLEQLRTVFRAANDRRMPIVVHMWTTGKYGADEARIFLNELVASAPDIPIQIAHLAGTGGYDSLVDQALAVFIDAIEKRDPRSNRLWFDVAVVVRPVGPLSADQATLVATRIRQLGLQRILYGSDAGGTLTPRDFWMAFRTLPLSDAEFQTIAGNIPPWMR